MFVTKQIGVLGLSQGGKIVPQVALRTSDVEYIVLMAAPGLGMKDFACLSSIALARVSGFNERDFDHIRELYDVLWPLYVKPKLSSSEITTAKQLLAQIASFMDEGSSAILNVSDVDGYFAFMRSHHVLDSVDDDPAETLKKLKCPVLAITGSKDVQVPAKEHFAVIEKASMEG